MPNYEIVDWIYNKLKGEEDPWKNPDNLDESIKSLDTKGVLGGWRKSINQINKGKNSTGVSLQARINNFNNEYITSIKKDIDKANTLTDLDKIDVDENYLKPTVEDIKELLKSKETELKEGSEILNEIKRLIPSKNQPDPFAAIDFNEIKDEQIRREAKKIAADKTREAESLEEQTERRLVREITRIDNIEQLRGFDVSESKTFDSESRLKEQISKRIDELSQEE